MEKKSGGIFSNKDQQYARLLLNSFGSVSILVYFLFHLLKCLFSSEVIYMS